MKRKIYHSLEMELLYIGQEDIVTASAGALDNEKDDDLIQDDMFA